MSRTSSFFPSLLGFTSFTWLWTWWMVIFNLAFNLEICTSNDYLIFSNPLLNFLQVQFSVLNCHLNQKFSNCHVLQLRVGSWPPLPPQSHWAPLADSQGQFASQQWFPPDYPVLQIKYSWQSCYTFPSSWAWSSAWGRAPPTPCCQLQPFLSPKHWASAQSVLDNSSPSNSTAFASPASHQSFP